MYQQLNFRSIFGAQKIQKRLNDDSDEDEVEEENRSKAKSELPEGRKPTRRKATDILAEVHVNHFYFCKCSILEEDDFVTFL